MDAIEHLIHVAEDRGDEKLGGIAWGRMATAARTELAALKAREERLREDLESRQNLIESLCDELSRFLLNSDESLLRKVYGDVEFEQKVANGKRVVQGALSDVLRDAASRAALAPDAGVEDVVRSPDPEWFRTDTPMRPKLTGWNPMSDSQDAGGDATSGDSARNTKEQP